MGLKPTSTRSGWRRYGAAVAGAAVVAAASGLAVLPPASAAVTGSVVFVKDHNVWVMPADDPSAARQVTTDGTAAAPYLSPTQDDSGRILAVAGGEGGDVVRMDQQGTLLGAPFRPPGAGNFLDLDLRADGDVFTYTSYGSYDAGGGGFVVAPTVDFAYADGRDPSDIANPAFDESYATFSTDRTVMTSYDADLNPTVATYAPGDDGPLDWFRPCDIDQSSVEDFGFCFPTFADVTTAQDRVAVAVPGNDGVPVGSRLWVFDMPGPAPAGPTWGCELLGPEPAESGDFEFQNPEWSPDGSALVYEYFAEPAGGGLANGIYVASGFDAGCEEAFATAELVVPGGFYPDWSPAPFGAPIEEPSEDPTDEPTDDPTEQPTEGPSGVFDGDAATTERINVTGPGAAALAISRARFGDNGAARVVLSRDDAFPDSLAGATLTSDGPLLFTATAALPEQTRQEIARVLPAGGTVHVLGGAAAVSQAVQDQLEADGFRVDRLAGPSRVETSIAVANRVRELFPGDRRAGLARAFGTPDNETAGWADSVTGGGWAAALGVPIVVTDSTALHPAVDAWLRADQPSETILFGGTAALSPAVEAAAPSPRRVAGAERTETAARIATELWGAASTGDRRFVVIDGFRSDGWGYGLAAGGMAADAGAPLLMVNGDLVPDPTVELVAGCRQVDLALVGSGNVVTHAAGVRLDELDNGSCR